MSQRLKDKEASHRPNHGPNQTVRRACDPHMSQRLKDKEASHRPAHSITALQAIATVVISCPSELYLSSNSTRVKAVTRPSHMELKVKYSRYRELCDSLSETHTNV